MANEIQGYTPKLKLGGTLFDVQSGEPDLQVTAARGDTTATGEDEVNIRNKRVFTFQGRALRYSTLNPHTSPTSIGTSGGTSQIDFKYYPTGNTGDDTTAWRNTTFLIERYSESFNAEQGLLTCTFSGRSSGQIKLPGES